MVIEGVHVWGSFIVFESGGSWEFLLGKPLLTALHAIHDYTSDTVTIANNSISALLKNQFNTMKEINAKTSTRNKKETRRDLWGSVKMLPSREVHTHSPDTNECTVDVAYTEITETTTFPDHSSEPEDNPTTAIEVNINALEEGKGG